MKILSFDSTAKTASCALLDDEKLIAESFADSGLTQSETLLPMAEHLLSVSGVGMEEIGAFACTAGPGSFTGVRIGVATVKGLAFGRGLPCVGVSTLEALAEGLRDFDGIAVACMDARRNQVYTATFLVHGGDVPVRMTEDRAIGIDELIAELAAKADKKIYFVGDGYEMVRNAAKDAGLDVCVTPVRLRTASAYATALVALRNIRGGAYVSDAELAPTYLRMPQAERERLQRENENQTPKG